MNYRSYIEQVMKLPFINDEQAADSAIKAVLGIVASKVGEEEARRLTNILPPELNFGTLLGHQRKTVQFSVEEFVSAVATQCHLNWKEANDLVYRVHCVKESSEGAEMMREFRRYLPPDWGDMVDRA